MDTEQASVRCLSLHCPNNIAVAIPRGKLLLEDCDITSNSDACIAIEGSTANPTIRGCQIHDSVNGVRVSDNGQGSLENCELFANAVEGVSIRTGSNPTLSGCQIHDNKRDGVYVDQNGQGSLENCEIFANARIGVSIWEGSNPTLSGCQIHDNESVGVSIWVHENGQGTIEDCEIFANVVSEVQISMGGDPSICNCQIHDGNYCGIWVYEYGQGTIEDCEIFAHAFSEVLISEEANPTIRNCQIHDGQASGILVSKKGEGTIEECAIFANANAGLQISEGGNPTIRNCRINGNLEGVVYSSDNGKGTIEDCDLTGNLKREVLMQREVLMNARSLARSLKVDQRMQSMRNFLKHFLKLFLDKQPINYAGRRYGMFCWGFRRLWQLCGFPPLQVFEFEVVTVNARGQIVKQEKGQVQYFTEDLGNGIGLEMVAIPGGKFLMGAPEDEGFGYEPQHQVTVEPFFMGKYPVTQAQWRAITFLPKVERDLRSEPSHFKANNRPVEKVSWYDAVEFCARLSQLTGREYRLPSEAEREYACRAGTITPFYFGETITTDLANYCPTLTYANEPKQELGLAETKPVGQFPPNAFGLYDMHGNVMEWCSTNYEDNDYIYYEDEDNYPSDNTIRGGSWMDIPQYCRSAFSHSTTSYKKSQDLGFRVACVALRTT